jgi:hypothetical protein
MARSREEVERCRQREAHRLIDDALNNLHLSTMDGAIPEEDRVAVAFCQLSQYLKLRKVDPARLLARHTRSMSKTGY